jgi:diguanylate cyclase (GGDEF)-like protein
LSWPIRAFHWSIVINIISRLFGEKVTVPFVDYLKEPVVVLKKDGRILASNLAFAELTGLNREVITGRDCRDVSPLDVLWNSISASALHRSDKVERITQGDAVLDAIITPVISNGFLSYICVEFKDMSSYVSLEEESMRRNKELVVTNALTGTFISSSRLDTVFYELLEKVLIISEMSMGWIAVRDADEFTLMSAIGVSREFKLIIEKGELDFVYDKFMQSNDPMYIFEPTETAGIDSLKKEGIVFLAAVPLKAGDDLMGFLLLASRVDIKFDFDLASLFSLLGNNLSLIAEKIHLFQESQRLAITDDLTGLYNVRHFYEILNAEIARTERYKLPFSLVLFDVDDFKKLNDTYGHQAGDEVLSSVASAMKLIARKTDTLARYGGEEFIAVLPNTDREKAFSLAVRIKEAVEGSIFMNDKAVKVTLSGGVATFPEDATDSKSLLYAADMAMYTAKAEGKDKICYYKKK